MKFFGMALCTLAGVSLWSSAGLAQVSIKAPFVQVYTGGPGGGVYVKAPFVTVDVPPKYPVYYAPAAPAPVPANQLPQPKPYMPPPGNSTIIIPPQAGTLAVSTTPVPLVTPAKPFSHHEFAKAFVPVPGKYKVTLIHPGSHCPVDVCFTLPPGCPKVRTGHRYLEFDYGNCSVEIRFALFGKVRVDYY